MSVYKRGKVFWYEFVLDGKRYRGTTKERKEQRAKQFEAIVITKLRENGEGSLMRSAPILRDFAERFLLHVERQGSSKSLDPDTVRYYKNGWRLLSQTLLAATRMDRIQASDLKEIVFPGGPSNANNAIRTLSRMYGYALEVKALRARPKFTTREEKERNLLIESQHEARLLSLARGTIRDVLIIILDSGMRPDEVLRMRPDHIHWERDCIDVPDGKSRDPRRVPLSDRMRAVLRDRQKDGQEWMFPGKSANGRRTTIAKAWEALLSAEKENASELGLAPLPAGLVLYCARHTFATNLLEDTKDIYQVAKVMGHSDLKVTEKYLHPREKNLAEIVNARNRRQMMHVIKSA